MAANWHKKIFGLKKLISLVGPLWPKSTRLSGYAENGPYHCEDCSFLRRGADGKIFKDSKGGRCHHPVVIADPEVKKDESGIPIVNIQHGCCEFVDQEKD